MLTDHYLTTVLEKPVHVVEQHGRVVRTTDNQTHEQLQYAVFRAAEVEADHLLADWTPIDGVMIG